MLIGRPDIFLNKSSCEVATQKFQPVILAMFMAIMKKSPDLTKTTKISQEC